MLKGNIYKIYSPETDKVYIGSTTKEINKRFKEHKNSYDISIGKKKLYISSFEILKYDNVKIELLEQIEYKDKAELFKKEKEYINNNNTVNKNMNKKNIENIENKIKKIIEPLDKEKQKEIILKNYINDEDINEYEILLNPLNNLNNFNLISFFQFIKVFKQTLNIQECLKLCLNKNIIEHLNKILLLRKFEFDNNIKPFDINFNKSDVIINITDEEFNNIKVLFRMSKNKPTTKDELKKVYIGLLRHLFGIIDIIISKQTKNKKRKDIIIYLLNEPLLKQCFNLIFSMNIKGLDDKLLNEVSIKIP